MEVVTGEVDPNKSLCCVQPKGLWELTGEVVKCQDELS
uniref:Uncharacterized protein n=1 Tax=Arundo donax TaxID=35708 RepID=A0A0A9AF77_ARUDO